MDKPHAIPNRADHQRDLEDAETLRRLGRDVPGLGSAIPNSVRTGCDCCDAGGCPDCAKGDHSHVTRNREAEAFALLDKADPRGRFSSAEVNAFIRGAMAAFDA